MTKKEFNKKTVTAVRYVYRLGIIKSIVVLLSLVLAEDVFEIKWKGQVLKLRKHSSDFHVFRQIQVFGQYDIRPLNKRKVDTIVDLGANIGLSVAYFKSKYPGARVIAVEPEKGNFRLLKENTGNLPGVHAINFAIWHCGRDLGLYDVGAGQYGYVVKQESSDEVSVVRAVTMDDIMKTFGLSFIDLLKIDIEGSEKELFSGDCSAWLPKVGCIVIELHDWFRSGCASAFFKAVSDRPYTLSFKGENVVVLFDRENEANA
jgi:FkbM family methyltransferase